jgi:DNA-binding transcriptional ArsR family regulator
MNASPQLAALADPTRRAVFEAVARSPQSVAELAGQLPVSRPAVSQHLKVLQGAGLVQFDRVGTRSIYQVDRAGLMTLRTYLDELWTQALHSLKTVAETTYRKSQQKDQ